MAIDSFSQPPLRHLSRFVSSGTFSVPEGATRLYVAVASSQGVNGPATKGNATVGSGYVNVIPGKTAQIIIGAAAANTAGSQGGTTSFDGAITVTGSQSGYSSRYGPTNGSVGVATVITSVPSGAPSGAAARVTSATTTNTDYGQSQNGIVDIYG